MHCDSPLILHRNIDCGDAVLHCAISGDGPLIVLLHGFPDFWYSWRHQIPAVAVGGARVIAPDLRGYNTSSKPGGVREYDIEVLANDVIGLIDQLAQGAPVVLAGHDWGGVIAWAVAARRPDLLRSLVILNAPHPRQYRRALLRSSQALRSWYAAAFQLPWLPERLMPHMLPRMLRNHGLTPDEIGCYHRAFPDAASFTAPLNYYRAAARRALSGSGNTAVCDVPTTVIWGEDDPYLDSRLLDGLERWVPRLTIQRIGHAGHFVQWDASARVSELLLDAVRL